MKFTPISKNFDQGIINEIILHIQEVSLSSNESIFLTKD
jgi:hypothetical protein